jgi:protein-S-isoprenylcysteine O-methyltransferase Ste14
MFRFLSRSRYGPFIQAGVGLTCIIVGLFVLTRIMLALGIVLVAWAAVTGFGRLRARARERDDSASL